MGGGCRAENKDFRLSGHLCASRFPSIVYCSFMPGQITNLTGQKAILFGQKAILFGISPNFRRLEKYLTSQNSCFLPS